eukprot:symbB.v1.2.035892.t1/scaffold4942.1/size32600/2
MSFTGPRPLMQALRPLRSWPLWLCCVVLLSPAWLGTWRPFPRRTVGPEGDRTSSHLRLRAVDGRLAVLRRRGGEHERVTSPYGSHGLGTVCGFGGRLEKCPGFGQRQCSTS